MTAKMPATTRLGQAIRLLRVMGALDMRTLGREIGISAATVCRLEAGMHPDVQTWLRLQAWLLARRPKRGASA